MRTKNAKRLWPVPATLAVVAVATLLAFGLLAVNGAQPAAAQDNADCEITVARDGTLVAASSDIMCNAIGDTATITFTGPSEKADADTNGDTDPYVFYVLSEDKGGDLSYYPVDTVYQGNRAILDQNTGEDPSDDVVRRAGFYALTNLTTADRVTPTRYKSQAVEVGFATLRGDGVKPQKVSIEVSGDFSIYPEATFTTSFAKDVLCQTFDPNGTSGSYANCDTDSDGNDDFSTPKDAKGLLADMALGVGDIHMVDVTFLGAPSLTQKDLEADDDGDGDGENSTAHDADDDKNDVTDPSSSMSAFSVAAPADTNGDRVQLWQLVRDEHDELLSEILAATTEVYIVAEIRDANGKLLEGGSGVDSAVTFNVMFHPDSDLESVARVEYSEPQKVGTMGRTSIKLTGWTTSGDTGPVKVTVTATYTGPSGTLELPKVELSRVADPSMLNAGTYICAPVGQGEIDEADDGCPLALAGDTIAQPPVTAILASNSVGETVFGKGEVIVVMSELLDELGSETQESASVTLSSDASDALTPQPYAEGATAEYMIKSDADLGTYPGGIIVSYGSGDDELEEMLTFIVSGEAENFMFDIPAMYIGLATGTSQIFTITGTDENGNVPSESAMVEVVVLGVASSYVSGIGSDNMLEMKDGSASFEIFTPVDAEQGDTALILVRVDGTEVARHAVIFGMAPTMIMPPMELGQAMDLNAMANDDGSITLMFTPGTSATHHFVSGNVSVIWEYADGMNKHTVSADQLTPGMEYKFYVLSGQWEEMADGKWEGMWAAEGWSNPAMSTAN